MTLQPVLFMLAVLTPALVALIVKGPEARFDGANDVLWLIGSMLFTLTMTLLVVARGRRQAA